MTEKISARLAHIIEEKGVSLRELSEMTGITKSALHRYATGSVDKMPIDRMQKIALALNVDPGWLMGWIDDDDHDDPGSAAPDVPSPGLSPDESHLLELYRALTPSAQQLLIMQCETMVGASEYRKGVSSASEK